MPKCQCENCIIRKTFAKQIKAARIAPTRKQRSRMLDNAMRTVDEMGLAHGEEIVAYAIASYSSYYPDQKEISLTIASA